MTKGPSITNGEIKRRVSDKKKRAVDFKRQKSIMDVYDSYYGYYRDDSRLDRIDLNFNLYNGRLDVSVYDEPISIKMGGEEVVLEQNAIVHYPFISQVARAMHGEQKIRPFEPVAKDYGPRAMNMRKRKKNELIKELLDSSIVGPLREEIFKSWMKENGVTDPRQMPPEMQQQMQSDIQNRMRARSPKEIMDYMENQYSTPSQRGAQQMLDFLIEFLDIKFKQDEGFKNGIVVGEEGYYIGERNGDVVFDVIKLKNFSWGGSENTVRFEKGDWAKYEQWFSLEATMQRNALIFKNKDLKTLEKFVEPIGGVRNGSNNDNFNPLRSAVMYDLTDSRNPRREEYEKMNISLKNDHNAFLNLYQNIIKKYGGQYGTAMSNYGIRESSIAWRDKRKLKYVIRRDKYTGEKQSYWLAEHYEPQPKDIEVRDVWVDEIWEGKKYGTFGECVYADIKPVVGQYRSVFDPFDVDLPYYGMAFNTHMNNSKNVSPVDLGKSFQKEIDATMANIRFDMSTDIGKVFVMDLNMKPENWTWQEFMASIKTGKMAPVNTNQSGTPVDYAAAKSIDMSRLDDISNKLSYLQVLRENLVQAMLFNNARIGAIGEYATNTNTRANQSASYNQTEDFFDTHRKIVERALNALISRAKVIYRNNKHRQEMIFDDVTLAEIKATEDFWYEANNIKISLSSEDIRDVNRTKDLALTLAQNTMSHKAILELSLAKTPNDVMNIMKRESKSIEAAQQAQSQAAQQAAEMQRQADVEDREAKFAHELRLARVNNESREMRSALEASQFERQADVDNNKIADSVERAEKKAEVDREKMQIEKELKEKELEIRKEEIKIKDKNKE